MTGYFAGGALGTSGSYAWKHFGWTGVCILGQFLPCCLYYCLADAKISTIHSVVLIFKSISSSR
jgi:hypothetical protein